MVYKKHLSLFLLMFSLIGLYACSSQEDEWRKQLVAAETKVDQQLKNLATNLNSGSMRNVKLLKMYADKLKQKKPELSEIVDLLSEDTTTAGPIYLGLIQRFKVAQDSARTAVDKGASEVSALGEEFGAIYYAATPLEFNNMLIDPINALAGMSDGHLSELKVPGITNSASQNSVVTPGSHLVGNPHYGHWQTDSSGGSFWAFYGQYAFFRSFFYGPMYYSSWSSGRVSSYYHDRGRDLYTSPSQKNAQNTLNKKTREKFAKSGKAFKSPYANNKPRSSGKSTKSFLSTYGGTKKSSSRSVYSSRNRSSRSGGFRGK